MTATTRITKCGRVCTRCRKWKKWQSFNKATKGCKGRRSSCQECDRKKSAEWKHRTDYYNVKRNIILKHKRKTYDPSRKKNYDLLKKYGITLDEYHRLFESQRGKCKICSKKVKRLTTGTGNQDAAVVDHCHKTGNIRGLLCHTCNRALGLFQDDTKLLRKALKYLCQA